MTESAPPLGRHKCLRESLDRKEETRDGVVASGNILTLNRKSASVVGRAAGQRLCLALLEEAGLEDPMSLG